MTNRANQAEPRKIDLAMFRDRMRRHIDRQITGMPTMTMAVQNVQEPGRSGLPIADQPCVRISVAQEGRPTQIILVAYTDMVVPHAMPDPTTFDIETMRLALTCVGASSQPINTPFRPNAPAFDDPVSGIRVDLLATADALRDVGLRTIYVNPNGDDTARLSVWMDGTEIAIVGRNAHIWQLPATNNNVRSAMHLIYTHLVYDTDKDAEPGIDETEPVASVERSQYVDLVATKATIERVTRADCEGPCDFADGRRIRVRVDERWLTTIYQDGGTYDKITDTIEDERTIAALHALRVWRESPVVDEGNADA